ncbi:MAG: sugar phosphate isomerase/epimerase family protein [Verrucomicrobiales bacterium]
MKLTGITDEAGSEIGVQIRAVQELAWNAIESRNAAVAGGKAASIHELPEAEFEAVAAEIEASGVSVPAIGSTVANWARSIEEPFDLTLDQLSRLIPRAQRLGTTHIRIMSYAVRKNADGSDHPDQMVKERIRRLKEINQRLTDAGLIAVHENCMNYGGMGISRTLELLDAIPGFKLVFDTANPVFNLDRDRPVSGAMQDPWAFYLAIREHIAHIHIKDCVWNPAKNDADYTWPGEGDGRVRDVLADLKSRGYDGWVSIEPHMAVVFHDTESKDAEDPVEKARRQYENFVEYGRRLESLIQSL